MGARGALGVALAVLSLAGTAQAQDREALGEQAVVELDARTGTPRMLARLDGTLTRASSASPSSIARAFVRSELPSIDGLAAPAVSTLAGITTVAWRQTVDGVPASDRSLKVNLDASGRVLSVLGAPARSLSLSTAPAVSAGEAVRAVQDDVGVHRPLVRRGGSARRVEFGGDDSARLVTFSGRLAWRVQYRAGDEAVYDATVDARTGDVLRRVNMVKSEAPALVWERYPGYGTAATVDLEARGYLAAGASTLAGPYVHAFSDVDDDDVADAGEEVVGGFVHPIVPAAGCEAERLCSWTGSGSTWQANRSQDTVQAFYLANRFRDHLATLGFDGFSGADRVLVHTMDGATTGPDVDHANNANMFTPPEGESPIMQMYLWRSPFRTVSSGSDAAVLYHEYTHGLSNRLVVDADGVGALNTAQAGAMGEGWSDWYAQDFIVGQFPSLDTGEAGEVDMGAYVNASSRLRSSALDCPVGASPVACPGRGAAGSGGYTYGDFGRIIGSAEVHYDGEIWAQTLWDLRRAVGVDKARALVTAGMRLLPPEPSFLDARNGILLADQALYAGADVEALWGVFAARGMGFFAASMGGEDTAPAEDFALPPGPDAPRGTITGRVTAALGGAPVEGVTIGLGGVSGLLAVTDADGRFSLSGVPAGTYPKVSAFGAGWDAAVTSLAVPGGSSISFDPVLRRNWASSRGGASVSDSNGREFVSNGCGPSAALDQSLGTTWSTRAVGEKFLVVRLPSAVDITQFGLDPAEGCGDSSASATGAYLIETSPDGVEWTTSVNSVFTSAARHQLNFVTPGAGAAGVRFVRLTLLSSQGFGAPFRDMSEFGVYGRTAGADTVEPETVLEPGGPPFVFASNEPGTFECRIDEGEWAACTSPVTPVVADGEHVFAVRAVDAAGNRDATPATRTFVVDTTAPETTLEAGGPPFVFASNEPGSFECRVDDGDFAACTSPHAVALPDGEHTFAVRAVDAAGNRDATPATRTFVVDATAPETTLAAGGPPFVFSSGDAAATFECRVDAGEFVACTSPHAVALPDGEHTFAVRAVDAAGNRDATPATRTFTVDTTAPETTLDAGGPPFVFASSEPGSFECRVDAGEFVACTSPHAVALPDGEHTFAVRAVDAAGNRDATPATRTFTVDATAPETTLDAGGPPFSFSSNEPGTFECRMDAGEWAACTSPFTPVVADGEHVFAVRAVDAAGNRDASPATRTFTVDATAPETTLEAGGPPFSFSSSEPGTFECRIDEGEWAACTSPVTPVVADGEHVFAVRAVDAAGNRDATPATRTFVVDATAPETTLEAGGPPFVFGSNEPGSFECRVDAGEFVACTSPHAVALPDGEHTFAVRAVDAAGNRDATPATRTFVVDTTAPETTLDAGGPPFVFASSEPGTFECKLDAAEYAACTSPHAVVLSDGEHTFAVRAVDAAGNRDQSPATRTFTVDTTAPETTLEAGGPPFVFASNEPGSFECKLDAAEYAACTSPHVVSLPDGEHTFSVRAVDAAGNRDATPATRTFVVDATAPETTLEAGGPPFVFSSNEPGTFECKLDAAEYAACTSPHAVSVPDGEHTFAVRAVDAAGNRDATPATRTFTVDTTAPETTLEAGGPPFVFSSSEPGSFECRVDNGDFAACTSPHAVTLPDGEHTFAVRAVDAAGNRDATPATRTFTVDTTAPETTLDAGGPPFVFSSSEPGTFECKLDAAEYAACTSPHALTLPDGEHTFAVRAIDAAGNRDQSPATRTFTVDSTAPETTLDARPALTNDSTPAFGFTSSPPGATFECRVDEGTWAACVSPHATDALADGRHVFEVRAIGANPDPTPAAHTFRVDTRAPETTIGPGPGGPVHSGPIAFGVGADEDATFACALDDGDFGSCSTSYRAEDLPLGEHVYRARATDRAGNVDATPAERVFVVANATPVATLSIDRDSGPAPHTPSIVIEATDADDDRLTYELDFGDGQTATGTLPAAAAIQHRYDASGAYTVRLTVRDARSAGTTEAMVTVTTPQASPGLSLQLSATAVSLGTFVPGLTRDYTGTLTATTTGNGTLTVSDPGSSPGYLLSGTTALARPLQVRATTGAFTPLTSAVAIPNTVEFRQSIAATDVLRPGAYTKALTFTVSPTQP